MKSRRHTRSFQRPPAGLDDGRLTDGQGRTVDFKNTIVVMTSNFGSQRIQEMTVRRAEDWEVEAAVRQMLRSRASCVPSYSTGSMRW